MNSTPVTTKICTNGRACHNDKPQSVLRFYKDKSSPDGYTHACRKCRIAGQHARLEKSGGLSGLERLR